MSLTTDQVPTTGNHAENNEQHDDGEKKSARKMRKPFDYTVLTSVDGGRTWTMLGEFPGINQREARQAAVKANDPLRTAIMEGQGDVLIVAVSRFNPTPASVRNAAPELVV
jgi:hypothetical protein